MKPFPHPWDIAEPQAKRDIVLAAVANDGFALRHASDALRADREAPFDAPQPPLFETLANKN